MRRLPLAMLVSVLLVGSLTGCQGKKPDPGDVAGYDEGEQYLSIWVHSIEDTDEGKCYRESVEAFNEKYNGTYYADIEFIPRNDSGGGYSDKINASVMSGDLPDVLTVDGPNIAAYASNGMIQPLAELTEEAQKELLWLCLDLEPLSLEKQEVIQEQTGWDWDAEIQIWYPEYQNHSYRLWFHLKDQILRFHKGHSTETDLYYDGTRIREFLTEQDLI